MIGKLFAPGVLLYCVFTSVAQTPNKVWSLDLRNDQDFAKRLNTSEYSLTPASIAFADDSKIILSFYDDLDRGYHKTDPSENYHLLGVSAGDGLIRERLVFSTFDHDWAVHPIAGGGFLVIGNQKIMKYGPGFDLQTTRTAPEIGLPDLYYERWMADCVPDGRTLVLYHTVGPNRSEFIWLNTSDLTRIRTEPTQAHRLMRASNAGVITEKSVCKGNCIAYFLLNDGRFVDRGKKYEVRSVNGRVIASGPLRGGAFGFTRSMTSPRVAFFESAHPLDGVELYGYRSSAIRERVSVLDWQKNWRIADIEFDEPITDHWDSLRQSALALSPDGTYLVVLLRYSLTCYRLR